jgi:hypothetical protein
MLAAGHSERRRRAARPYQFSKPALDPEIDTDIRKKFTPATPRNRNPNKTGEEKMQTKIKIHDGIVGALILLSVVLGMEVNPLWFYLAGGISVLMVASAFTGFCPVYFVLNKIMPSAGSDKK